MLHYHVGAVLAALASTGAAHAIPSSSISACNIEDSNTLSKRGTCDTGSWVPGWVIGGRNSDVGPNNICETHWGGDYQPITGLEAWTDNDKITGVRATYSGGAVSQIFGRINSGQSGSITVDYSKGEKFTTVVSYGNGIGTRLGHMYLETSGGQKLDIGKNTDGITPYSMNVGGGILLGLIGSYGDEINAMGYLFISSTVQSVSVGQMTFDPDPSGTNTSLSPLVLSNQHYYNDRTPGSGNVTWNFSGQQTETQSNTYTQSSTTTFGGSIQVEVSAELFGIGGKVTTGFTWESSQTTESASSTTSSVMLTWGETGSLQPGQGVDCTAYVQKGQGNFAYTSHVTMLLVDGTTYSYVEKGRLNNVAISEAYISVKEDDSQNAPPGVSSAAVSSDSVAAATMSSATSAIGGATTATTAATGTGTSTGTTITTPEKQRKQPAKAKAPAKVPKKVPKKAPIKSS